MIRTPRLLGVGMSLVLALFPLVLACAPGSPAIVVLVDGVPIAPHGEVNFGELWSWEDPINKVATIKNTGDADLELKGTVTITNDTSGEFTLISPPSGRIPAGGQVQFTIRYDSVYPPGGERRETVTIASNDPDNPSYAFDVFGTCRC